MERVKGSIAFIQSFLDQVPLVKIYILITKELNFIPKNIASGEDWFSLYRSFWKTRLDKEVKQFIISCRKKETLDQAARVIHKDSVVSLPYYSQASIGSPVRYEKSLGFLNEFIRRNFALSMYSQLKRILIDGEFYKEQNSEDFSEAFSGCNELESRIDSFLSEIGPGSHWARELERIRNEPLPEGLRNKKAAAHAGKAEKKAQKLIKDAHSCFHLLVEVVNGILYGEKGGRFDTLSNLGYMGGRDNQDFLKNLARLLDGLNGFYAVFSDLIDLEENSVINSGG